MTTPQSTTKPLQTGTPAPKFSLSAFPSGTVSLDQFNGQKNVILAFYPKDDTPGCTKEMCAFSTDLSKFEDKNTVVLGISTDDVDSHSKFAGKYELKQTLLADHNHDVAKAYGVLGEGKSTASRMLFIIDKHGVIQHIHEGMPDNNTLLELVSKLK
ncbi:MAG TPA: peroxiredoxin [Planktothrix sp.]|jgi:peroxiredoxin Q/BCP